MKKYVFGIVAIACLVSITWFLVFFDSNQSIPRPNIIIIQADDLGFGDIGYNGNTVIQTPNIDKFATESVVFNQFYTQSVCAPSRASLLTGKHFLKTGVSGVHGGRDFININQTTIAQKLKEEGYVTGMWGKWHSGKTDGYFPWDKGFDEAYMSKLYQHYPSAGLLNGKLIKTDKWSGQNIASQVDHFLNSNKDKPFFGYISFLAPHGPWASPDSNKNKYLAMGYAERSATLFGMIDHLDQCVGQVLNSLDKNGLSGNTVVIFMSDNGPWTSSYNLGKLTEDEWKIRNPVAYRGNKGTNWENGIKSPLFIKYGSNFEKRVISELVTIEDIYPTVLSLCDIDTNNDSIDGVNFIDALNGKDYIRNKPFYISQWNPEYAKEMRNKFDQWGHHMPLSSEFKQMIDIDSQRIGIRANDYKLLYNQYGGFSIDQKALYNISKDPLENNNLTLTHQELSDSLFNKLSSWYKEILNEPRSYNAPVFQIGFNNRPTTYILACGSESYSPNFVNDGHGLIKTDSLFGEINFKIKVHREGLYKLRVICDDKYGIVSKHSIHNKITIVNGNSEKLMNNIIMEGEKLVLSSPIEIQLSKNDDTIQLKSLANSNSFERVVGILLERIHD